MYKSEYKGKGGIEARVIEHSVSDMTEILTMELTYPRFIHSEFMTHRVFSRNASSSRAIPVEKMLHEIQQYPAMPIHWGKNQPGMQAREEHNGAITQPYVNGWGEETEEKLHRNFAWAEAAGGAVAWSRLFSEAGYHKQIVNRLTEPFQFIKVIVTSTEWDNFFKLRLHEDAQPEIYELSRCMFEAMESSEPTYLEVGEWHLPLVPRYDEKGNPSYYDDPAEAALVSAGRCARVSYKNHDGSDPDWEKDKILAERLYRSGHMSPFEHQATPMSFNPIEWKEGGVVFEDGVTHFDRNGVCWSNNFRNWIQYRSTLNG